MPGNQRGKRIAIIGAGPIGLEAAVYARALGYEVILFERGEQIAENVKSWGFLRLFSPWSANITPLARRSLIAGGCSPPVAPGQEHTCPMGSELREKYLVPLVRTAGLEGSIRTNSQVMTIGRDGFAPAGHSAAADNGFRILLRDSNQRESIEQAEIIFDCSGTYGNHRWAGRGGVPAPGEQALSRQIWYTMPDVLGKDRERFANRHTLLLGCGFSAASVLNSFEKLYQDAPDTRLTWAIRRPGQAMQAVHGDALAARTALAERSMKLAESPPPWLHFLGTCVMEEIRKDQRIAVTLRSMQMNMALTVDEVVAMVGYMPDSGIYEQLQIHQCYATGGPIKTAPSLPGEVHQDGLIAGTTADPSTGPAPNFFILGAKSYGTNSNFLLSIGHQQIVDAFRLLQNDPKLNLYQT
jgi:hypothetical protein